MQYAFFNYPTSDSQEGWIALVWIQ